MRLPSIVVSAIAMASFAAAAEGDAAKFYESKVRPLLLDKCIACHGADVKKMKGDLRLDTKAGLTKGGSSGPVFVKGDPAKSIIIHAVGRRHPEVEPMPPDGELTKDEVATLAEWIRSGPFIPEDAVAGPKKETVAEAKLRWPYAPLAKAIPVPADKNANWATTEIDRFILAKLEAKQLVPVGDADRRSLIRRVTYDLIGLPPSPEEVEAFIKDDSARAFERVVDRLLASPHYGERWGRHWLDVVRYADTAGDNADFPIPQHYLYRNWVIDAINRDLPFDQFAKQQIAGDLMTGGTDDEMKQRTIATGYLANARRFGSRVDDYPTHLTIEDTIDNLGRAFLGLSLNCARCHDHKFDPVSMADYYGLYGIFASTRYPWPGIELEQRQRDLVPLVPEEQARELLAERERKNKEFEAEIKKLYAEKSKLADKDKPAFEKKIEEVKKQQRQTVNAPLPFPTAYAVAEGKKRESIKIQLKGDPEKRGAMAPRKFLDVLGGALLPDGDKSSGRLALADWIASKDNPLFARVIANRIWYHHFGRGLVPTTNDFGKQGTAPTHPELLDFLARSLVEKKWSLKALHKQILLSRTYRLSTSGNVPGSDTADPNNELLWKFRQRRLDAESIRDTLLSHGGHLDATPGEGHPFPEQTKWNFTQHNPFRAVYDHKKRSVYLMTQRIQRHPFLAIFDGADTGASTGSRITSTTALQSLYFLNDPFVHEQAAGLAERMTKRAADEADRIDWAYRLLFARPPSEEETKRAVLYLKQVREATDDATAWESLARSLFRLNEFVYLK